MARENGASEAGAGENGVVDWTGKPFSCQECPHQAIREEGRCVLGRICVRDQRAKRIDRFFAANTGVVGEYLEHPYFEIRAIAAAHHARQGPRGARHGCHASAEVARARDDGG